MPPTLPSRRAGVRPDHRLAPIKGPRTSGRLKCRREPTTALPPPARTAPSRERREEIVSLVVDNDKGREINNFDAPDRLHSELGIFDDLDLLDTVLRKARRRAADRAEIEPAVLAAGSANLWAAIALRQSDETSAGRHEGIDIAVQAPGRGRPEGARSISFRRLGRTGVIDRVVLDVIGQPAAAIEPFLQLGMSDVASDDQRAGQAEPGLDRVSRKRLADLAHRPGEIDRDDIATQRSGIDVGQEARRVRFELLQEDAVDRDLAEDLTIGRAGHADADRQAGAMPRQSDHPYVVAEILAAELRADSQPACKLQHLPLKTAVAIGLAIAIAFRR